MVSAREIIIIATEKRKEKHTFFLFKIAEIIKKIKDNVKNEIARVSFSVSFSETVMKLANIKKVKDTASGRFLKKFIILLHIIPQGYEFSNPICQ